MTPSLVRWRGRWPSVFQTEQNEQCFGHPRTVCTDAHMYRFGRHQVPSRRQQLLRLDASPFVRRLQAPRDAVLERPSPGQIAVTLDDGVGATEFVGLLREERGVDATVDHGRAGLPRQTTNLIAAERVARVDADADDIASDDGRRVQWLERFVGDDRVAVVPRRRLRQYVQPPRRDDADAE